MQCKRVGRGFRMKQLLYNATNHTQQQQQYKVASSKKHCIPFKSLDIGSLVCTLAVNTSHCKTPMQASIFQLSSYTKSMFLPLGVGRELGNRCLDGGNKMRLVNCSSGNEEANVEMFSVGCNASCCIAHVSHSIENIFIIIYT